MSIIDRSIQPLVHEIKGISLPHPELISLSGGAPLYAHRGGTEDIVRVEVILPAGSMYQEHPLISNSTLQMLQEGTKSSSGEAIAEALEFYGAYLNMSVDQDFATLSLHCMSEYLDELLPVLAEIISEPTFPQKRFDVHLSKIKQKYNVNIQKVDFLARRRFLKELFGENHPVGRQTESYDFDTLNRGMLKNFHSEHYLNGCVAIFIAGRADEEAIQKVEKYLGFLNRSTAKRLSYSNGFSPSNELKIEYKTDSVQSGIRLGCLTVSRKHSDFAGLQVLNTLLGGYFGSRLMQKVREDLGYTYGIGSYIMPSLNNCYFAIGTETGTDVTLPALDAIKKEIEGISIYPPDEEELQIVKNYMLGKLLKSSDGAFARTDRLKTVVLYELPDNYYESFEETIRNINIEKIIELKNKYINFDSFIKVIAGNHVINNQIQ